MKILFRKRFKKLREEYADLGETKLDIIEDRVNNNPYYEIHDFLDSRDQFGRRIPFDETKISRDVEYLVKYRKLVQLRSNVRVGALGTALSAAALGLIGAGIKVAKNNNTLEEEYNKGYYKGRSDQSDDWIEIAEEHEGELAWLADTEDNKHVYIQISEEETDEYKEYYKDME